MNLQILHVDDYCGDQKSRGPDWGLTSSWRPFGLLDFVLRATQTLRLCDPRRYNPKTSEISKTFGKY